MRLSGDFGKKETEEKRKESSFFSPRLFSPSPKTMSFLNPVRLAKRDVTSVFSSLISLAVLLGLILIPGLYAWFNLGGEFDLYSRTKDLKIDVVNQDAGYSSPLLPLGVNFGSKVIGALQKNPKFLWREESLSVAQSQVESGEAYAAIEIPKDFSKGLMNIFSNPSPLKIKFLVNQSITPLSPKLTQEGADDLENEARQVFVSSSLKIAISSLESFSSLKPGSSLNLLSSAASSASAALQTSSLALLAYSGALKSAGSLLSLSSSQALSLSNLLRQNQEKFSLSPLPSSLPKLESLSLPLFGEVQKKVEALLSSPLLSSPSFSDLKELLEKIESQIQGSSSSLSSLSSNLFSSLSSGLEKIKEVESQVEEESRNLNSTLSSLSSFLSALSKDSLDASFSLSSLSSSLSSLSSLALSLSSSLSSFSSSLSNALPSLPSFGSPQAASSLLSSPVEVKEIPVWPVSPFGSAITPFYCALAMWIGCLLDCLVIKMRYSYLKAEGLWNLKRWHLVVGRWISIEIIAFFQCEVTALGCLVYMGSQLKRPWLFFLAAFFCSLSFSSLSYALVRTFGEAGKMACELILIFQITASGGIYPLELLPVGAAKASLFLPATWAINIMRPCVGGSSLVPYWKGVGVLGIFFAAAWILCLGPGRLFSRLSEKFSESLESGGLAA
ncbi:MAG: YhgE/Pip family protein [Aeriscardovia sp.]|nr:YhgE/Pip family protein [Aeriscardovia sp.]